MSELDQLKEDEEEEKFKKIKYKKDPLKYVYDIYLGANKQSEEDMARCYSTFKNKSIELTEDIIVYRAYKHDPIKHTLYYNNTKRKILSVSKNKEINGVIVSTDTIKIKLKKGTNVHYIDYNIYDDSKYQDEEEIIIIDMDKYKLEKDGPDYVLC